MIHRFAVISAENNTFEESAVTPLADFIVTVLLHSDEELNSNGHADIFVKRQFYLFT